MNEATQDINAGSAYRPEDDTVKAESTVIIPVIHEELKVGKETIESGKVRLVKTVNEHLETVNIPLNHEEYQVERVAVHQYLQEPPAIRYEGDVMIIPVIREELVVEKRLLLVEELRVTKTNIQTSETRQVLLRQEEVNVERINIENREQNSF